MVLEFGSMVYLSLILLYKGQYIRKCFSSSTSSGQFLQNLSVAGIDGLLYLPVSIARECALILNLVKCARKD